MHIRIQWLAASMVCAGLTAPAAALAQNTPAYPGRAVTFVVPFPPGGSTDIIARAMTQELSRMWGQPALVDNRGGGNSTIGTDIVAKAAPDGYTLLNAAAPFATNVGLYAGKLPYDIFRDFAPVMLINTTPLVMTVYPGLPAKSVKELIALARSKPGQMNFGSSSLGGINHLAGELFNMLAGTQIVHVAYKGNAPALTDLMGGRLDFVFNGTTSVLAQLQSGKLRALAVSSPKRASSLPDIPTLDESGLKGFDAAGWNALVAPARVPAAILAKLNTDANRALASPDMQKRLGADGSESAGGSPDVLAAYLREEAGKWTKVIKAGNIRPE